LWWSKEKLSFLFFLPFFRTFAQKYKSHEDRYYCCHGEGVRAVEEPSLRATRRAA
jgi:hypothetical protein